MLFHWYQTLPVLTEVQNCFVLFLREISVTFFFKSIQKCSLIYLLNVKYMGDHYAGKYLSKDSGSVCPHVNPSKIVTDDRYNL